MPLEVTITNEQKVRLTAVPVTATGNPAPLDGPVSFSVISGDSTVNVLDNLTAELVSGVTPGDTTYLVEADADLGAGVETISDTVLMHVEGARAANLGLSLGVPEPK